MGSTMQKIGRYSILKELGRGAMGVVYAATDPLIGRTVAIKTIRLGGLDTANNRAELTQRLQREAQSAGILSHPGIITIYDIGEENEDAYIVMEYVDGKTLEELLDSGVPQRSKTLLSVLHKAAAALDYAHSKGIVHRDVKPSNIMICSDEAVKIADFGVAKFATATSLTQSGFVLGTPNHMSPEQAQGRGVDGRSDQFSLAVVAYRMLTGKLPFEGPTLTALLTKILWEEPEYESAGLYPPVRMVFKRALSKDPHLRFPTCTEFVRNLEEAYGSRRADVVTNPQVQEPAELRADSSEPAETAVEKPQTVAAQCVADADDVAAAALPDESAPKPPPSIVFAVQEIPPEGTEPAVALNSALAEEKQSAEPPKAQAPKKKSRASLWAASVGILALLTIIGIVVFRSGGPEQNVLERDPGAETHRIPDAAPANIPSEQTPAAAAEIKTPPPPPAVAKLPDSAPEPSPAARQPKKTIASEAVKSQSFSSKPAASPPVSGILTWSGNLERNAILVISGLEANTGKITGQQFPGKPIEVQVEPKDIAVRRVPAKANAWNQIMLHSGSARYESITIRWKITDIYGVEPR
jgi:serine/threonine-protein kinase